MFLNYRPSWQMAVFTMAAVLLVSGCGSKKVEPTSTRAPDSSSKKRKPEGEKHPSARPDPLKPIEPDFAVTAAQLADEYAQDRPAAIKKYAEKWVVVTGEVLGIRHFAQYDPETDMRRVFSVLTLRGAGDRKFVNLETQSAEPWKSAHPGQTVRLRARGRDEFDTFSEFSDCVILSASGPKVPSFTVAQLAREVTSDPKSFRAKYSDKNIFVSGEITSLKKEDTGGYAVVLSPVGSKPPVTCDLSEIDPKVGGLKVGQKVTVMGLLLVQPDPPYECWLREGIVTDVTLEPRPTASPSKEKK